MALYRTGLYVKNHTVEKVQVAKSPIASYNGNVTGLYIPELIAYITAVQSGSGDPAPDNIRPISGWSEANVCACGTNVWDEQWENGTFNTTTGENINNPTVNLQIRSKNLCPIFPNVQYYFYVPISGAWFIFYDADKNVVANPEVTSSGNISTSGNSKSISRNNWFSVNSSNVRYMKFYMLANYGTTYNNDISINFPVTDTNYHAYTGNTYKTSFGQTIYGGELDVTSGVLTVTHANIASYNGEPINEPWICSEAVYSEGTTPPIGSQVVYPLATPITVQLTPTQVEQLLGQNNVWADTGDVEVKFFNVVR